MKRRITTRITALILLLLFLISLSLVGCGGTKDGKKEENENGNVDESTDGSGNESTDGSGNERGEIDAGLEIGFIKVFEAGVVYGPSIPSYIAIRSEVSTFDINDVTLTFYHGYAFGVNPDWETLRLYMDIPSYTISFFNDDGMEIVVKTVEDNYVSEKYNVRRTIQWLDDGSHITTYDFNHFEELTIPAELFTKMKGTMRIRIRGNDIINGSLGVASIQEMDYEIQGNKVILSEREYAD